MFMFKFATISCQIKGVWSDAPCRGGCTTFSQVDLHYDNELCNTTFYIPLAIKMYMNATPVGFVLDTTLPCVYK